MSSHAFGSPTWSAEKDFALLMLLAGGNRKAAQQLWLRKGRIRAPPGAGAQQSAPKAAQQVAGLHPKPAPAQAQAVPKPETAAQLARRERNQLQLRQKHLARKMWACVRIASRLLAWHFRARYCPRRGRACSMSHDLPWSALPTIMREKGRPLVIRVSTLLRGYPPQRDGATAVRLANARRQQDLAARIPSGYHPGPPLAALPAPPTSSAAAAQPPPALTLVAPPPPTQQPPLALVAAARASLDELEMQDDRGSKRDAHARTPPPAPTPSPRPPPAESRKKTRGAGAMQAALAAAAPAAAAPQPHTATTYHAAALAAANPHHPLA